MTYGTVFPSSKVNGTVVFHPTLILYALRLGVRLVRFVMCFCMFGVSVILDWGLSLAQSSKELSGRFNAKDRQLLHLHTCTGTRQHSASGSQVLAPGVSLTQSSCVSALLSLMFPCGLPRQDSFIMHFKVPTIPRHREREWSVQRFRVPTAGTLGGSDLAELVTAEAYLMFP